MKPPNGSPLEEQVRLLREEVDALRTELKSLRQELGSQSSEARAGLSNALQTAETGSTARPGSAGGPLQEADASASADLVQSQLGQLAQTKVESNSKMPITLFGTILSTTFYNTRSIDWADEPVNVNVDRQVPSNTGSFSSSLRQSRLGLLIDGPKLGSFKASGVFALDFNGGQTAFGSTPLFGLANIVYAYARLENAKTAIEAGQDEMIFAPRNPTSLVAFSYPELYRSGNLYLRAPQVRIEQSLSDSKLGHLKVILGLVAPVGTYPQFDFPGANTARLWQRPAVQGRLLWTSRNRTSESSGWEIGFSGHYGRVGLGAFSAASWAGAFDFDVHARRFGLDGEGYLGQNLQSFGGGISQPGKTLGGYAEARFQASTRLRFNAGVGTDHLTKLDIIPVQINRNSAVFANTIFQFTPEVGASFEYRHMMTRGFDTTYRKNENLSLGLAYSF